MNLVPCRDCGQLIYPDSRGCNRCARNLDAERAVAKYLRLGAVLVVAAVMLAAYFILGRG